MEMLTRGRYPLPRDKADALAAFLSQHVPGAEVAVDGDVIQITGTRDLQNTIASLIGLMQSRPRRPGRGEGAGADGSPPDEGGADPSLDPDAIVVEIPAISEFDIPVTVEEGEFAVPIVVDGDFSITVDDRELAVPITVDEIAPVLPEEVDSDAPEGDDVPVETEAPSDGSEAPQEDSSSGAADE
jgi:hypothetical protein